MAVHEVGNDPFLDEKLSLTQHVVSFVTFESADEAYYFAACGNSSPATLLHWNSSTSKSYGTPSILEIINIPKYNPANPTHARLAELSEQCHQAAALGNTAALADLQAQVDAAAATLWNIDGPELAAIHQALEDMKKVKPGAKGIEEDTEEAEEE